MKALDGAEKVCYIECTLEVYSEICDEKKSTRQANATESFRLVKESAHLQPWKMALELRTDPALLRVRMRWARPLQRLEYRNRPVLDKVRTVRCG